MRLNRTRIALVGLLILGIVMSGSVLLAASNEVNRTRGDFCGYLAVHVAVLRGEPPSPARVSDARADRQLEERLGC